ncbi:MAG: hypothetical protein JWQ07_6025, partial [Ramlibacter sp.]|nr:hypothetical protein [Ramlibacter sp.]
MGAALTYARRYALFAVVGITGEDDLDAPDDKSKLHFPVLATFPRLMVSLTTVQTKQAYHQFGKSSAPMKLPR